MAELSDQIAQDHVTGFTGIAHTRWATHGVPATHNAHPHFSHLGNDEPRIALVHNGIIENHDELRAELQAAGYAFESQTDTEVIAHLVNHLYAGDLFEAVQAVRRLHGAYAIAVFCRDEPHRVVGARQGAAQGGRGPERELPGVRCAGPGWHHRPDHLPGRRRRRRPAADPRLDREARRSRRATVHVHTAAPERPYRHYMQAKSSSSRARSAIPCRTSSPSRPSCSATTPTRSSRTSIRCWSLACGSYYAGLTAKYWIESVAKIPVNVEIASEYR